MDTLVGKTLSHYRILEQIGRGGMGVVYRAHDEVLRRDVAVKVLSPSFASDPDRLRRFEQEARSAGALNHPNILAIYDFGEHEGSPYAVAELLEGKTLREQMGGRPIPARKAAESWQPQGPIRTHSLPFRRYKRGGGNRRCPKGERCASGQKCRSSSDRTDWLGS